MDHRRQPRVRTAGAALAGAAVTEALGRAVADGATLWFSVVLAALALATSLPVAIVRPRAAAIVTAGAGVIALSVFDVLTIGGLLAIVLALWQLGHHGEPGVATVIALPFAVMTLAGPPPGDSLVGVMTAVVAVAGPAAGWHGASTRAGAEASEHREARRSLAGDVVEHTARGERARIARELHDVVAHHVSMVAVQAETARLTTPGMPPAGAERLSAIGDTARTALSEMRRLLGVLREDVHAEVAERRPQPRLGQLDELLDATREASGSGVRLILSGAPVRLDAGVELAGYRIVQEALTNARRHAPGAAIDVELRYDRETLVVRIRDNGPGPAPGAPDAPDPSSVGHGLAGMRERAAAVGGELRIGAAPGGGFLVEARLPVTAEVSSEVPA